MLRTKGNKEELKLANYSLHWAFTNSGVLFSNPSSSGEGQFLPSLSAVNTLNLRQPTDIFLPLVSRQAAKQRHQSERNHNDKNEVMKAGSQLK